MNLGLCTIASKSRLCQAIALYNSLERNTNDFTLFVLCIDKDAYDVLSKLSLEKAKAFILDEVENEELLRIKSERTENEYCWTLKPVFLKYVLDNFPNLDVITHVDADLYFFSDPQKIYTDGDSYSVLLTTHLHAVNDDVNSGFVSFKNNEQGRQCLAWWIKKCLNWCYFRKEDYKFGDQGYLDRMLVKFEGVHVVDTPGVNIAPWNSYRFTFEKRGPTVFINDNPLLFYHFCGFRLLDAHEYGIIYTNEDIPAVYEPYVEELGEIIQLVECTSPGIFNGMGADIQPDAIMRRGAI